MTVGSVLAAGVISNLPDTLKTDPTTTDAEVLGEQDMVFRVMRWCVKVVVATMDNAEYFDKLPALTGGDASVAGGGPLDPAAVGAGLLLWLDTPAGKAGAAKIMSGVMGGGSAPVPTA